METTVNDLGARKRNVGCVKTDFTGRTDFIFVRYFVTDNYQAGNNGLRSQDNVVIAKYTFGFHILK